MVSPDSGRQHNNREEKPRATNSGVIFVSRGPSVKYARHRRTSRRNRKKKGKERDAGSLWAAATIGKRGGTVTTISRIGSPDGTRRVCVGKKTGLASGVLGKEKTGRLVTLLNRGFCSTAYHKRFHRKAPCKRGAADGKKKVPARRGGNVILSPVNYGEGVFPKSEVGVSSFV